MRIGSVEKQPTEIIDRDIMMTDFFSNRPGDSLDVASVTVDDQTLVATLENQTGESVKLWLSGGVDGKRYKATVTLTTVMGRKIEAEIMIKVREI